MSTAKCHFSVEFKSLKQVRLRGLFLPTCYSKLGLESGQARAQPFISLGWVKFNPDQLPTLVHPTAAETHQLIQGKQACVQDARQILEALLIYICLTVKLQTDLALCHEPINAFYKSTRQCTVLLHQTHCYPSASPQEKNPISPG